MKKIKMVEMLRGIVCLVVVAMTLPFAASADTFTWTGDGANKKWSTAANWSPNGPLSAADTANFQTGTLSSDTVTYDSGAFKDITVQSGAWTANVSSARFTLKPITVSSGASFALAGASAAVNPFDTNKNANAVAGLLDLGGANQTIADAMSGSDTGFFRNGGEIRNGTLTIDPGVTAYFANTAFTVGSGANVTGAVRVRFRGGARLVVDGGTFTTTHVTSSNNNHPIGDTSGTPVIVVRNGGKFVVTSAPVWLAFSANATMIGDSGTIDLQGQDIYLTINNSKQSVLALTNSVFTCGTVLFGYATDNNHKSPGKQTLIMKDSVANITRFNGIALNQSSSILFDGATLVPKYARTDFLPNSAAPPTLGAGGLIVSNNYDITIAKGLAGAGALVKTGNAALTLTGTNTFTGGIDLRKGTLVIPPPASFVASTLAMADGTTLRVKFSPDSGFATTNLLPVFDANTQGRVTVEIDTSDGLPVEGQAYKLFAPGLSVTALSRITVVPDAFYTFGFAQDGALTLTMQRTPVTHVWTGGGTDAKWTTTANWDVNNDFGTLDRIVFGGTGGYSIYDSTDGLHFENILVDSCCHTVNVATASFVRSPVTVTNNAAFVLENASGVVNPFSTNQDANAVAGLLDLGGATQTIATSIDASNPGFFRDGCEIRNGTLTVIPQANASTIRFKDTTITVGPGANVSGAIRVDLNNGHFVIDGGTLTSTYADRDVGNHPIGRGAASSIMLRNGGRFVSPSELWIGFNANGTVVGNDCGIDLGAQTLYMSINGIESLLALTNSTLTCGKFQFGYSSTTPGVQTVSLKDTVVNLSKFAGTKKNANSTFTLDGVTLIPKAAATDFMPASANIPTPTIGAGGLTVSNAYDITIAKGLAGTGRLVKKGEGELTLSGADNTLTGGIDVQAGALAIGAGASFADSTTVAMADGTTLTVKFSPDGGFASSNIVLVLDANTQGRITVEIDVSAGMPEANRAYTLLAPGLNAATLSRLSIDPAFSSAFSESGALTLTLSPKTHAWTGGGADAKWTTTANWNISDPVVTCDHVVFTALTGHSIYDCADGMRLASITAGYGVHTADVASACFANVPITVAGGATFALKNADGVTNAFSTAANTNVIAGVLDLGGATQTISTTMEGNGTGSFRDGGEIRNGTVTLTVDGSQTMNNTAFTFGDGLHMSSSSRFYLQNGAYLKIDGGTYTNTFSGNNHVIGANSGVSTLEVSNGGQFVAKRPWFVGHTYSGSLIGDGCVIDVGNNPLYLSNNSNAKSVLALTNAVLTCSDIQFAYGSNYSTQTLVLKNSVVNLADFIYKNKTAESSILFDGATLVPKAAAANFMPSGLPSPTLGAGGLVISNAFDVTVAVSMTGTGGIVKQGAGKLTVTGDQSFAGDVVVSNGTFTTSSTFAGGLRVMSGATIDVADAMFGGDIALEAGVALTATNGVDWTAAKFVPIAKTTANASFPSGSDADGRHFFVKRQGGVQTLYYGRKAGLVIMMR